MPCGMRLATSASVTPSKAIIISTHILEEVDAVCTRAVIIDKGFRRSNEEDTNGFVFRRSIEPPR